VRVPLLRHLRRNAVAYLALFIALGGTSFAAATVITGKDVKNGSLTGKDVKNSSLTGGDVKNKSLTPSDFNGSVQGPKGDTGPQGAKGDPGLKGETGVRGERGPSNAWVIDLPAAAGAIALPAGKFAFTGAVSFTGGGGQLECSTQHAPAGLFTIDGTFRATAADGVAASLPVGGTFQLSAPGLATVSCAGPGTNLDLSVTVIQVGELEEFAAAGRALCNQLGGTFTLGPDVGKVWTCSGVGDAPGRLALFGDACRSDSPISVAGFTGAEWVCATD